MKLLLYRRILRILDSYYIEELYNKSSDTEKNELLFHCLNANISGIKKWINKSKELGDLRYKDLRNLAQDMHIKNYSRLTKEELIKEIQDEKERNA